MEIKYRAYIKELGKIYEVITLMTKKFEGEDFLRVFINKEAKEGEPANYRIDGVDNILMQYTGLKDKNGKKIYEGNLLENRGCADIKNGFGKTIRVRRRTINEVIFDNGAFCGKIVRIDIDKDENISEQDEKDTKNQRLGKILSLPEENIIIGNIYENPSLIDNK